MWFIWQRSSFYVSLAAPSPSSLVLCSQIKIKEGSFLGHGSSGLPRCVFLDENCAADRALRCMWWWQKCLGHLWVSSFGALLSNSVQPVHSNSSPHVVTQANCAYSFILIKIQGSSICFTTIWNTVCFLYINCILKHNLRKRADDFIAPVRVLNKCDQRIPVKRCVSGRGGEATYLLIRVCDVLLIIL